MWSHMRASVCLIWFLVMSVGFVHAMPNTQAIQNVQQFCQEKGMKFHPDSRQGVVDLGTEHGKVRWLECSRSWGSSSPRTLYVLKGLNQPVIYEVVLEGWHKRVRYFDANADGAKELYVVPQGELDSATQQAIRWCSPYQHIQEGYVKGYTGYLYDHGVISLNGQAVRWVGCESEKGYSGVQLKVSFLHLDENRLVDGAKPVELDVSGSSGAVNNYFSGWVDLEGDGNHEWVTAHWQGLKVWRAEGLTLVKQELRLTGPLRYNITDLIPFQSPVTQQHALLVINSSNIAGLIQVQRLDNSPGNGQKHSEYRASYITDPSALAALKPHLLGDDSLPEFNAQQKARAWAGLLCKAEEYEALGDYFISETSYPRVIRMAAAVCLKSKGRDQSKDQTKGISPAVLEKMLLDPEPLVRKHAARSIPTSQLDEERRALLVDALYREQKPAVALAIAQTVGCQTPEKTFMLLQRYKGWGGKDVREQLHQCLADTVEPRWYLKGMQIANYYDHAKWYLWRLQRNGLRPSDDNWGDIVYGLAQRAAIVRPDLGSDWSREQRYKHLWAVIGLIGRIKHPNSAVALKRLMLKHNNLFAFYELASYKETMNVRQDWLISDLRKAINMNAEESYRERLKALGTLDTDVARTMLMTLISTPDKRAPFGYDFNALQALNAFPSERSRQFLVERCQMYIEHFATVTKAISFKTFYQMRTICDAAEGGGTLPANDKRAYQALVTNHLKREKEAAE